MNQEGRWDFPVTAVRALGTVCRALLQAKRRTLPHLLLLLLLLPLLGGCLSDAAGTCFNWDNANDTATGTSCDGTAGSGSSLVVIALVTTLNEVVVLVNQGDFDESLTGWKVENEGSTIPADVYTFGTFTLSAGRFVRLNSDTGTDDIDDVYWDGAGHWDAGDTAVLYDETGSTIDSCSDTDPCWDAGN